MKNSEKSRQVIENFILHVTHCSGGEDNFEEPINLTPKQLYEMANDYIKEDHVDGEGNPDDYKSDEQMARELLESKGLFTQNLWSIEDVKGKFECTDEQAHEVLITAFANDATYEQIWMSIDYAGESMNLNKVKEEA